MGQRPARQRGMTADLMGMPQLACKPAAVSCTAPAPDERVQGLQGGQRGRLGLAPPLLHRLAVQQQRLQQQLAAVQAAEQAAPGGAGKIDALLGIGQRLGARPALYLGQQGCRAAGQGAGWV